MITRKCEGCGSEFEVREYLLKHGRGKYCSKHCRSKAGGKARVLSAPLISPGRPRKNTADSFWSLVTKIDGCWLWHGTLGTDGYGRYCLNGKLLSTHRLAYQISKGKIPAGMQVCHTCDNPACINPDHLFLGTRSDNMKDMMNKGRGKNQFSS